MVILREEVEKWMDGGEFACVQNLGMSSAFFCFSFKLLYEKKRDKERERKLGSEREF